MATIKAIEGRSVHQIQSGQVIVDLQSVCKELVENSIDAGATSIEVRFKNNGLDSIEVQDNGAGIAPADYDTIALKHYTSKLATYDDLSSLQTFGFRGEALSSLCALSHFHIVTTRASDGPKGTKLEFEQSGKLKGTSVVAAKQGTTVVVDTLFYNLPVRRKELEKNIKREYNKVLQLLNAYACISVGVKFSVSNLMSKGKKTIAFSTNANPSTKDNISNVYGAKTITALIPLGLSFELDPSTQQPGATQSAKNWSTQDDAGSRTVRIEGHISRPVVGEGRQTPDRQMFFVNSRPCNLPQVAKAFNEVYKSFNITQSPFVFADIKLDTNAYDVNVSPDKRTIMLHDQTALLENLKNALLELFEGQNQSVPQAQLLGKKPIISAFRPPSMQPRVSTQSIQEDEDSQTEDTDGVQEASARRVEVPSPPGTPETVNLNACPGFVKASLIERFAGRDAEDRVDHPPPRRKRSHSPGPIKCIEPKAASAFAQQDSVSPVTIETSGGLRNRSSSPIFEPELQDSEIPMRLSQPPKAVEDFNARIASQQALQARSPASPLPAPAEKEPSIPFVKQTPQKTLSQSSIQNAFDRMRPMRTPVQQATITIGDTTTVSTIGTSSQTVAARRARIYSPKFSLSGQPLNQTPRNSLFRKGLSGFAAPGTQAESSEDEDEGEGVGDNAPDASTRSPSPHKRFPFKAFEEPRTGDTIESSSAPPAPRIGVQDEPLEPHLETVKIFPEVEDSDGEYIDEREKKAREEAKIAQLIAEAEEAAARPTDVTLKRASKLFKVTQKKYWTINLERVVETDIETISRQLHTKQSVSQQSDSGLDNHLPLDEDLVQEDPEERLSLTVTKSDFNEMRIIGQFNLGFIIAVRPPTSTSPTSDLFIIDQHASDEKYNFERLSATTTLTSQRLVHPHPLELTAVEEELILANEHALTANGFVIEMNTSNNINNDDDTDKAGHRAKLTALPMSKEVTFTPTDLEELLALILDNPPSSSTSTSPHIPRPSKVRKLLASRACRSSVMIGKTLQPPRMREIVRHMGSMDKPWSCPHGRPTMRHLFGLERWVGWTEGDGVTGVDAVGVETDWGAYLRGSGD
ncbi:DNA mismatch repair protein-like protein pms1 [Plenodomus tracheiphilus IPT5]|uniref:DNA mismatch repair protein PMS1 n=1 Tax=Plenodomus tracheiphilus IPT5 TaxID=1408161 RepID=A0A6A7B2M1_9PLEO|nr:DNA mismatch repair protein-like protein pms1 [Plenodomus tracheiphilus IPT5]